MNSIIAFLTDTKRHLDEAGIKVSFLLQKEIKSLTGSPCLGYFDDETKELAAAVLHEDWLFNYAHEYCHFQQYTSNLWTDPASLEAYGKIEDWINRTIELEDYQVEQYIRIIQLCELDCEKRTVRLLEDYQFQFDKERYIKLANKYVLSYEASRLLRKDVAFTNDADHLISSNFVTVISYLPSGLLAFTKER